MNYAVIKNRVQTITDYISKTSDFDYEYVQPPDVSF